MSEPSYAIAWTAPARRALTRLPEKAGAVVEFLYASLAANPHRAGKPLKVPRPGLPCVGSADEPGECQGEPMLGDDDRTRTPEGVFGSELRYYRERAGLSQTELGQHPPA